MGKTSFSNGFQKDLRKFLRFFPIWTFLFLIGGQIPWRALDFWEQHLSCKLREILTFPSDPILSRFFKLFILSEYGNYSLSLSQLFSFWGLLHVLVISGSQVSGLESLLKRLVSHPRLLSFWLLFFLTFWVRSIQHPPPFVRACLITFLKKDFPQISFFWLVLLSLFLQSFLYQHHLDQSFYLSWMSFFIIQFESLFPKLNFSKKIFLRICLSFLCQFFASELYDFPISLQSLISWILGNLLFSFFFDHGLKILSALSVLLSFGIFVISILTNQSFTQEIQNVVKVFFLFFSELFAKPLLVALFYFRYN